MYTTDAYLYARADALTVDTARTTAFRNFMATHPEQKATKYVKINGITATNPWGTTYHHATTAGDPIWKAVGGTSPLTKLLNTQGVHIPDATLKRVPTGTQDRPMLIVDEVFGYSAFFADVKPNAANHTFTCSNAALYWHTSNGLDGRNPKSNDKRNYNSRGRIPDAMCIPGAEIKAAAAAGTDLGRKLQIFHVETRTTDGYTHPMVGCENGKNGFGAEGELLRLKPSIDYKALGASGAQLSLLWTMQRRGMYFGDNSGSSARLKGEQGAPGYLPYAGTNITPDCLAIAPWTHWEIVTR